MADVLIETGLIGGHDQDRQGRRGVWNGPLIGYKAYINSADDLIIVKTEDGGETWGAVIATVNQGGTVVNFDSHFVRWTPGVNNGTVWHFLWEIDFGNIEYRAFDIATDTFLATRTTVFSSAGSVQSIICTVTDDPDNTIWVIWRSNSASIRSGMRKSDDGGVTWSANLANPWQNDFGITGRGILMPSNETDLRDVWFIRWDTIAAIIELGTYDDSLNTWSFVTIRTAMEDDNEQGWGATQRKSDSHVFLAALNEQGQAVVILRFFEINGAASINERTIVLTTAGTEVVTGRTPVMIDEQSGRLYVGYLFAPTVDFSTMTMRFKTSDDGGVIWSAENAFSDTPAAQRGGYTDINIDDRGGRWEPSWITGTEGLTNFDNSVAIGSVPGEQASGAVAQKELLLLT